MNMLKEREEAAEREYVVKLEQSFHIRAMRDRMLAHWAADLIGREDFDAYFGEIITADLAKPGDEALFSKLWADLQSAGASIDEKACARRCANFCSMQRKRLAAPAKKWSKPSPRSNRYMLRGLS